VVRRSATDSLQLAQLIISIESLGQAVSDNKRTWRERRPTKTRQKEFEETVDELSSEDETDIPAWTPEFAQNSLAKGTHSGDRYRFRSSFSSEIG